MEDLMSEIVAGSNIHRPTTKSHCTNILERQIFADLAP